MLALRRGWGKIDVTQMIRGLCSDYIPGDIGLQSGSQLRIVWKKQKSLILLKTSTAAKFFSSPQLTEPSLVQEFNIFSWSSVAG